MAGHKRFFKGPQFRIFGEAALLTRVVQRLALPAAVGEAAPAWWIEQRWNETLDRRQLYLFAFAFLRQAAQKPSRIWMPAVTENVVDSRLLHDAAGIHHGDLVAHLRHHAH